MVGPSRVEFERCEEKSTWDGNKGKRKDEAVEGGGAH